MFLAVFMAELAMGARVEVVLVEVGEVVVWVGVLVEDVVVVWDE